MSKKLIAIFASLMLSLSISVQANQPEAPQAEPAPIGTFNPFDPNAWMGGFVPGTGATTTELKFNAAHPADWMKWVDPKTHTHMHMTFANPATYAQFVQPQFYFEFMKPENMMAWMDFNQYAVMMDPQTMTYWMNPASYMHAMDPAMYTETMNPANYMIYMNPNTYLAGWTGGQTCDPKKNPNAKQSWFGYHC